MVPRDSSHLRDPEVCGLRAVVPDAGVQVSPVRPSISHPQILPPDLPTQGRAEGEKGERAMTNLVGRENVYTCQKCGAILTTVDRDSGTTPFMLACRNRGPHVACDGFMQSSFYPRGPRPAHIPAPTHEWYKPKPTEVAQLDAASLQHVAMGGLLLRPIQ